MVSKDHSGILTLNVKTDEMQQNYLFGMLTILSACSLAHCIVIQYAESPIHQMVINEFLL